MVFWYKFLDYICINFKIKRDENKRARNYNGSC